MARNELSGDGFSVSFSGREVSAWGGLVLFKQMLDHLGFRHALGGWGLPAPRSNRGYDPAQLIEQFIVSIWCGACRFVHAETVRMDSTLTRLFGWRQAAGHKAIVRLFSRFNMLTNEHVQAQAYRWLFGQIAERLHEEADQRLAELTDKHKAEIAALNDTIAALRNEEESFRSQSERLAVELAGERAAHTETLATLQEERVVRAQMSQRIQDMEGLLAKEDAHRATLEEKGVTPG